jgi:hypothetical protein
MMRFVKALVLGFIVLLMTSRASSAQECYYDVSVYVDHSYVSNDTVEVYAYGVDYSYCPGFGHFYDIVVHTSGTATGLQQSNDYYGSSEGTANFYILQAEYLDYGADLSVWCSGAGYWVGTVLASNRIWVEPPAPCGRPTGFGRFSGPTQTQPGHLGMTYAFGSTTSNLADLNTCSLFETLSYSPSTFPSPPWQAGYSPGGEHLMDAVATSGFADDNMIPGPIVPPYGNATVTVTGTQVWTYQCNCYDTEHKYPIGGPYDLNRVVSPNGGWKYVGTKHGVPATWNLP